MIFAAILHVLLEAASITQGIMQSRLAPVYRRRIISKHIVLQTCRLWTNMLYQSGSCWANHLKLNNIIQHCSISQNEFLMTDIRSPVARQAAR